MVLSLLFRNSCLSGPGDREPLPLAPESENLKDPSDAPLKGLNTTLAAMKAFRSITVS